MDFITGALMFLLPLLGTTAALWFNSFIKLRMPARRVSFGPFRTT